jgi:ribosomal protein S27AE
MTCTHAPERASSHAKSELFCQRCDHASPVDGDWIRDDAAAGLRLLCPRCGNAVVTQPDL